MSGKLNHFFDDHLEFGQNIRNMLHRLRIGNNNMKHSEQEDVKELSLKELKDCLEFVCFIDKDENKEIKDKEKFLAKNNSQDYDDYYDDDDYYDLDDDD